MTLKLAWDADRKEEQSILIDRHTNLLMAITDAIEGTIYEMDCLEAEQGGGRMTGIEISGVMANAVIGTLQERGVSMEQFLKDLRDMAPYQGWE